MGVPYNRIAGRNPDRLAALSDGVFAVAMTLLVLDVRVPDLPKHGLHSERAVLVLLAPLGWRFVTYLMSFLTLGMFWVGQQAQLNALERSDRDLTWIHLAFLLFVTLVPFSTALLAELHDSRVALLVYWLDILLLGSTLYAAWRYALKADLVSADIPEELRPAVTRRIVVAQLLYAAGAALCFLDTRLSVAFIVLVQLNYAIAPRVGFLWKL